MQFTRLSLKVAALPCRPLYFTKHNASRDHGPGWPADDSCRERRLTPPTMRLIRFSLLALILLVPAGRLAAADSTAPAAAFLTVVTPEKTTTFTAAEFAALPHSDLKLAEQRDKQERTFSGVPMRELLTKIGAPLGDKFRGPALTLGVLVRCKDGYTVLYSVAEFDENFSTRTILLADREEGAMLPPSSAPLRLIAPGDKRGARSARQVVSIEVISAVKS